jgi:hypothetical protein
MMALCVYFTNRLECQDGKFRYNVAGDLGMRIGKVD